MGQGCLGTANLCSGSNVLEVPPSVKSTQAGQNSCAARLSPRIKMFYRPAGLAGNVERCPHTGSPGGWSTRGAGYACGPAIPSLYHVSISNLGCRDDPVEALQQPERWHGGAGAPSDFPWSNSPGPSMPRG